MSRNLLKRRLLQKRRFLLFLLVAVTLFGATSCRKPNVRPESQLKVNKTGYPILDEMTVFDIGVVTNQSEEALALNDYQIFDDLAELTNVKINWVPLPRGNHVTKLILQLVSGQYPEAFMAHDFEPYDWQRLADQGILVPLEGYVEDGWMPNFSAILEKDPRILAPMWMGEHFYSLPSQDRAVGDGVDKGHEGMYLNLNRKWMEKLGLEVPNTLDEFYEVLKAFKEGDPDGNGKADDIPLTFVWSSSRFNLNGYWNAWKLVDNNWAHYMVRDGKVLSPNMQPEYRDAVLFLRKLYDEGLIDMEFVTQDEPQFLSKIKNGQAGAWFSGHLEEFGSREENEAWARENVVVVPPFVTSDGSRWLSKPVHRAYPGFEISIKCKSPEALLRWVDAFYDEYYGAQGYWGAFGQGLEEHDDGTLEVIKQEKGFDKETITLYHGLPRYLTSKTWGRFEKDAWDIYADEIADMFYPYVDYDPYLLTAFSKKDNKTYGTIHTDLQKLIHTKQVEWITGVSDINEDWDAYIAEMEKIGVHEMLEILQKNHKP